MRAIDVFKYCQSDLLTIIAFLSLSFDAMNEGTFAIFLVYFHLASAQGVTAKR